MIYYNLNTELTFGQYKDLTVYEILDLGFKPYIEWCLINLDHFVMDQTTLFEIEREFPEPKFVQEAYDSNDKKNALRISKRKDNRNEYHIWREQQNEMNSYFDNYNDDLDADQQGPDFWNQF